MNHRLAALVALTCTVALTACATPRPYKYAIPNEAREMFSTVEVVTPVAADKIAILPPDFAYAPYNSSTENLYGFGPSMAGNLIVNLAIAGANQRLGIWAEEDVQPLRAALGDFQLAPMIETDLNMALADVPWLKAGSVRITREDVEGTADKLVATSKASAILWTPVQYNLTDKADRLVIQMRAFVFPVSADLKRLLAGEGSTVGLRPEQDNILYRNLMTFTTAIPGATTDRVTNVAMWAKDDATAVREALEQGSTKLVQMLIEDIAALPNPAIAAMRNRV